MALYRATGKALATAANTNVLELRAGAQDRAKLREIKVFAEAATALNLAVYRTTVIGTSGTAQTIVKGEPAEGTPAATVVTGPAGGTLEGAAVDRVWLPATAGAGGILTYVPGLTDLIVTNGLSLMLRNDGAIGPAITWTITWDE